MQLHEGLHKHSITVMQLFKEWDQDHDCTVSREEFRRGVCLLGFEAPPEEIDSIFDAFDETHNGSLEFGELKHALSQSPAYMQKALHKKNAEMQARLKNVKSRTDNKGQDIQHGSRAGYLGSTSAASAVTVPQIFDDLSLPVALQALRSEVGALEVELLAAREAASRDELARSVAREQAAAAEAHEAESLERE